MDVIADVVVIPDVAQDVDVTITVAVIMAAELPCLETVETALLYPLDHLSDVLLWKHSGCGCNNNGCNDSCWIIILLLLLCGNGCGCNNCC